MINRLAVQREKGFSLMELMVAVAVAGILASIGMPYMRDILLNQQVKTAASDIHLSLLFARSEAIKRSVDVELERNSSWENGWDVELSSDGTQLKIQDPLGDLTIDCNTDTDDTAETCPATVVFSRTGRADSFIEFRLYVSGNDKVTTRCVSLRLSGVPQVTLDDDGNSANGCG